MPERDSDTSGSNESSTLMSTNTLHVEDGGHYLLKSGDELPYRLRRNLGHGHSGNVEEVEDTRTGAVYALKTIRIYGARDKAEGQRIFDNEIKILRHLASHHHFIRIFATYIAKHEFGLILQPVADSGDLDAFLYECREEAEERGAFGNETLDQTKIAILQRAFGCLANGLEFMHQRRVRHKDIKPRNILIHQGLVLYTDFGYSLDSSQSDDNTTTRYSEILNRRYSAPEVLQHEPRNSSSDIFSLGCVFIEMLSVLEKNLDIDERFFYGEDISKAHHCLERANAQKPSRFLADLSDICISMTRIEPSSRLDASQVCASFQKNTGYLCAQCYDLLCPTESNSDISDMSSVFSTTSSFESGTSAGFPAAARMTATEYLGSKLFADSYLQSLYIQGVRTFGRNRFFKNHDRLLKKFLADLSKENADEIQMQAVLFLQRKSQREQVTEKVCREIENYSNPFGYQDMKEFSEQGEDRSYSLNRYLRTRYEAVGMADGPDTASERRGEKDEEREEDDKEGDEEEEEVDEEDDENNEAQVEKLFHLESLIAFFMSGPSFWAYISNLHSFVNPPQTIEEALNCQNIKVLRRVLKERFEVATEGQYSWIRELDELGYPRDEIADILFEQANDAPWIYFERTTFNVMPASIGVHLSGCAHQFLSSNPILASQSTNMNPGPSLSKTWHSIAQIVEELCGLAGIAPTTRDKEQWDGTVTFKEQNSVAIVTYSPLSGKVEWSHRRTIFRLRNSLERFCLAAGHAQTADLCCDSFTILCLPPHDNHQQDSAEPSIEVCQIAFHLPLQMLSELNDLLTMSDIDSIAVAKIRQTALRIFPPLDQEMTRLYCNTSINDSLHLCSLAIQVVCLGFLSYAQAHAGYIQPFFLDTPQRKVRLLGSHVSIDSQPWIEAGLEDLTCASEMIRSQVFVFSLQQPRISPSPSSGAVQHDLQVNAVDLIDTWGPGHFLIHPTEHVPFAIQIGDGIVYASNSNNRKYHWSNDVNIEQLPQIPLDPLIKMVIGASVTVNDSCRIDTKYCWENSSTSLEPLGTYRSCWEHDERQFGIQAGNYAIVQAIAASHKLPGRTLKQYRLHQEDEFLIPFLDDLWGVQVSFCTNVARRVTLRQMVADLLPIFAAASISSKEYTALWEELLKLDVIAAFQQSKIRDWLNKLTPELHRYILGMVRRILGVLQYTGIDRERKNIVIAWPYEGDIFRCFRVACEKESSWAGVLEDSEDSATFAYITTRCFETKSIKCSGPNPAWQGVIHLLETAVVLHARNPSALTTVLEHNTMYFFQKLDHLFFVKAQKSDPTGVANLKTVGLPSKFQQRLLVRLSKQRPRIRERITKDDFAENVYISEK